MPACGHENPDTNKFCGECATPLSAPARPVAEERKVVSVPSSVPACLYDSARLSRSFTPGGK